MGEDWTDRIVGARMELDREFEDRLDDSRFSNQQWGLIMTAVEFEVRNPDDPDAATLVADTSKLPSVMPELDSIDQAGAMGGGADGRSRSGSDGDGGFVDTIKDALGVSGTDGDDERLDDAEELTQAYADDLQAKLEERGRWDEIREAAGD